ncbi:glycine cleavage system protein R [Uliginosibacterium sp. H1]|uniref:glycine cleavage system protein R n=1 Tax=Uliginosibacterium sp. H1 TaxID=3114757 RepID=UPI002E18C39D|nr:ACT domain-containing protein [Uliginosibacterium sp. H1]
MSIDLILTVIGDDRPGLVEELASGIAAHGGNWLESSLSHLSGKFAGIVRVECPPENAEALRAALASLPSLTVSAQLTQAVDVAPAGRHLTLSLTGHDRVGIVREVSQVIARHGINVEGLTTWTSSAPMSGETLFHAEAALHADANLDADALQAALEAISNELVVDILLDEIGPD